MFLLSSRILEFYDKIVFLELYKKYNEVQCNDDLRIFFIYFTDSFHLDVMNMTVKWKLKLTEDKKRDFCKTKPSQCLLATFKMLTSKVDVQNGYASDFKNINFPPKICEKVQC